MSSSRRRRSTYVSVRQQTGPWTIIGWIFIICLGIGFTGVVGCSGCAVIGLQKAHDHIEREREMDKKFGPHCYRCDERHFPGKHTK